MTPEGWQDACLGDLVRLQRGHDLPATDRIEGRIQVIGGGGPNGFHNTPKASAPGIVIGRSGSGIGNAWWSDEPFWPLNTGLYVTNFLGNDPRFCFYWLDWIDFQSHNSGGAQPSLNRNFIYPIPILIPPPIEQKKIAEILSTWDKAIETTEKLLANAESQKRALMQQLLTGERRLKGFEGHEWSTKTLAKVTTFIRDGTHGTHTRYKTGVPMISAVNITDDHLVDFSNAPFISSDDYAAIHKKYEIRPNDILLTIVGTIGRNAIVELSQKFTAQRSVAIIRASEEMTPMYLAHVISSPDFQRQLRKRANITAQPGVYLGELAKIVLPAPQIDEQREISAVLKAATERVRLLKVQIQSLKSEKRALMQQLLSGKRRVMV